MIVRLPISRKTVPDAYVDVVVAAKNVVDGRFDVIVLVGVYTVVVANAFSSRMVESICQVVVSMEVISV